MKNLTLVILTLLVIWSSLSASEIHSHPLSAHEQVKGWILLSDNPELGKKAIDRAVQYDINHLQLSHNIIHHLKDIRDPEKRNLVHELAGYAHEKGIQEVVLWDHSLYDIDYYPKEFRTAPGGKINLDNPMFWEWLKNDYREMLDLAPDIQGLILTFIETGARIEEQYSEKMCTNQEKLAAVVNAIASVVIDERGMNLYARTFSYSKREYANIIGAVDLFDNDRIRLMMKETPHDFLLTHPNDQYAGKLKRPTIIEFDAAGEFNGQGVIANTWPGYILSRCSDLLNRPHVNGYAARVDRFGTTSLIGRPGEINLYALKRFMEDRDIDANQIYHEFIVEKYGKNAYPFLVKAFSSAFDIVTSSLYTLGTNVANHSSLDYEDYPSSYIRHVSGKWLEPPVVHVEHNVDRKFHYWKDIVNHIAPVWVKKGNDQFAEIPEVIEQEWLDTLKGMDELYLRYILKEKDYGVDLARTASEEIDKARSFLSPADYTELCQYFERTLLTAELHQAVASLYYGFRVYSKGKGFHSDFVKKCVSEGLDETRRISDKISNYPHSYPKGEWDWKEDAVRAMKYYNKVRNTCPELFTSGSGNIYPQSALPELFALDGKRNLMKEEHFGIINGHISSGIHYRDIGTLSGLYAPPYASSDFLLELRLFGEKVPTDSYRWYPFEVTREGRLNNVNVSSSTILINGERAILLRITLLNQTEERLNVPLQLCILGGLDYVERWDFLRPDARNATNTRVAEGEMVRSNKAGSIHIGSDIPDLSWFEGGSRWNSTVNLLPGQEVSYHIALEIGGNDSAGSVVDRVLKSPENALRQAKEAYARTIGDLLGSLPKFSATDERLENYYYRSLTSLFINQWRVPEFVLHPYYGSGAMLGGCVTLHLWEFGLPAQLFPLVNPAISREHIKQFLKVDITKRSRFEPMTGEGAGSWYQVNQDKIIELIYFYVLNTGDTAFLEEHVGGLTVFDHVLKNALFGDDPGKPVTLIDYGQEGENHLELRRGYPYHGVMPDVNALRYLTYVRAYELSRIAGKPRPECLDRAEALKKLLRDELWSEKDKWFYFKADGKKDIRLSNFMYTLIGTGVFDKDIEEALLSHMNEKEFLGDYGIHSISKTDPAYDQADLDHGGGGSYVAFPPLICQRLYTGGYGRKADDLLERHLWWGERLPYWGDSMAANYKGYREDTPLQSDFDAITGAQMIIFGIFGVEVNPDGSVTVDPAGTSLSSELILDQLQIRGHLIDIEIRGREFLVRAGDKVYHSSLGKPIVIR